MSRIASQPADELNALDILTCDLYFACHNPLVARHNAVLQALKLAICLLERETLREKRP